MKPWQPLVEVRDAGQVVEHALVDSEQARRQRVSRADLDQTPVSQRRRGRERVQRAPGNDERARLRLGPEGGRDGSNRRRKDESSSAPAHMRRTSRSNGDSANVASRVSRAAGAGKASDASRT